MQAKTALLHHSKVPNHE